MKVLQTVTDLMRQDVRRRKQENALTKKLNSIPDMNVFRNALKKEVLGDIADLVKDAELEERIDAALEGLEDTTHLLNGGTR